VKQVCAYKATGLTTVTGATWRGTHETVNGQAVNAELDPAESKGAAGKIRYTSHRLYVRDADPKVLGNQHSGAPFVRV